VKNCLILCQSTVTLCLVSNQVSRSSLVLVWPIVVGSRAPRCRLATAEALCRASCCEVLCVGKSFWI
jgi:hypothetical protein